MTDLTLNSPRTYHGSPVRKLSRAMSGNFHALAGAALMLTATGVANCTPTASGKFAGFAAGEVDNRTGSIHGGPAGAAKVECNIDSFVHLTVAHTGTYALDDDGATVYASDSNTFTLDSGTNNIPIGTLADVPFDLIGAATGEVLVAAKAAGV